MGARAWIAGLLVVGSFSVSGASGPLDTVCVVEYTKQIRDAAVQTDTVVKLLQALFIDTSKVKVKGNCDTGVIYFQTPLGDMNFAVGTKVTPSCTLQISIPLLDSTEIIDFCANPVLPRPGVARPANGSLKRLPGIGRGVIVAYRLPAGTAEGSVHFVDARGSIVMSFAVRGEAGTVAWTAAPGTYFCVLRSAAGTLGALRLTR